VERRRSQRYQLVVVDQSPIGTSPSSNPATYTGAFTHIRELFAATPLAKQKGFGRVASRSTSPRAAARLRGQGPAAGRDALPRRRVGHLRVCRGRRYNSETLTVEYRGKNIAQVLAMEVDEALQFFGNHKHIVRPLQLLHDVGLGYLTLGQPANTFSGGEAQRIKLCAELAARKRAHMIYVLDEPTTGLHSTTCASCWRCSIACSSAATRWW
jgi:excinuclease ABC subunit A